MSPVCSQPPRSVCLVSRHRSSVGLRWPSKLIAALHRLPIHLGMGKRCALRCAPMAARSLRHLIRAATPVRAGRMAPTPRPRAERRHALPQVHRTAPTTPPPKPGQGKRGQVLRGLVLGGGGEDARAAAPGLGGQGADTRFAAITGCSAAWYAGKSVVWPIRGGANAAMADTSASNGLFSSALPAEVLNCAIRLWHRRDGNERSCYKYGAH